MGMTDLDWYPLPKLVDTWGADVSRHIMLVVYGGPHGCEWMVHARPSHGGLGTHAILESGEAPTVETAKACAVAAYRQWVKHEAERARFVVSETEAK